MIYGVFGLPRSGKTTYLAKLARKFVKRGIPVFLLISLVKGCYKLQLLMIWVNFDFSDSVILIDEISLVCDSRGIGKNSILTWFISFFTNHGHYNIDIYTCFSVVYRYRY